MASSLNEIPSKPVADNDVFLQVHSSRAGIVKYMDVLGNS